jgi:hypothetical protein
MPETQNLSWIEQWGSLVIAFIALSQPWIISLYKKFIKSPQVKLFEAGKIEIGYSNYGPTIGLNGTLIIENKDVFIRNINLELKRERDNSTHIFEWSYFRSNKIRLSQPKDMEFELAAGFMLSTKQPQRFNILFIDNTSQKELFVILEQFQKAWNDFFWPKFRNAQLQNTTLSTDQFKHFVHPEFTKADIHIDTWGKVDRIRYWEKGKYSLKININSSSPDKTFNTIYNFTLTDDERLISYNSMEILDVVCNVGSDSWNFANCDYEKLI